MSDDQAREAFHALVDDDAEALYDLAPCGYLSTTPDGTIVKVNRTFLTHTGYERADLVGRRTFAGLLSAGGRIYYETHLAPMLRLHGNVREIALDVVAANGDRLPVLVNALLERDPFGAPVVIRAAVFDATERRRYERELLAAKRRAEESEARASALARTLQQTLIPPTPPQIADLDVAAAYRPAGTGEEVGGDFYDVFQLSTGDWVIAIGDVCGKGVEAAVVTALVRYTLRAVIVQSGRPSDALEALNDVLLRHESDRFCTMTLLRLRRDNDSWTATVGSAGHPLPMLAGGDGPVAFGHPGSLLGVIEDVEFDDAEMVLAPGDSLVLYTDGVTEGRRGDELFGEDRLAVSVATHAGSAKTLVDGVLADVLAFQDGLPRDDIAVAAVRVPSPQ